MLLWDADRFMPDAILGRGEAAVAAWKVNMVVSFLCSIQSTVWCLIGIESAEQWAGQPCDWDRRMEFCCDVLRHQQSSISSFF